MVKKEINLADIINAIQHHHVRITDHADEEAAADHLIFDEILFSVTNGEIIEAYPADRPFPSCLIFGQTPAGEPVHSVWAYNETNQWSVLITVYRPDPARWIGWRVRRSKE